MAAGFGSSPAAHVVWSVRRGGWSFTCFTMPRKGSIHNCISPLPACCKNQFAPLSILVLTRFMVALGEGISGVKQHAAGLLTCPSCSELCSFGQPRLSGSIAPSDHLTVDGESSTKPSQGGKCKEQRQLRKRNRSLSPGWHCRR